MSGEPIEHGTIDAAVAQAPRRIVPLEGGLNFRDLGGYAAADGRSVAWGLVYRSGTMAELVDGDHAAIQALGIKLVLDLRSTRERRLRPSRLPVAPVLDTWFRDHRSSAVDLVEAMGRQGATATRTRDLMIELYRSLPYEQAPSYREMFLRLAAGDVPLVFHCAAGKDRTGAAAALLLELLGVSRAIILDDFTMTNLFFERLCGVVRRDPVGDRLGQVDRTIWEPLLRADPEYLLTMFATLDARHGGAEGFIRQELGIDDANIASIRERLLE